MHFQIILFHCFWLNIIVLLTLFFWLSNKHILILNNKSFIVTPIKAACEMWSGNKLQLVWAKHNIFF